MEEQKRGAYVQAARNLGLLEGSDPTRTPPDAECIPEDADALREERYEVSGLVCPACSHVLEQVLVTQKGVQAATVDFFSSTALVRYDMRRTSPDQLNEVVAPLGYEMDEIHDVDASTVSRRATFEFIACAIIFMNMMSLSMLRYFETAGILDSVPEYLTWVEFMLCLPVMWLGFAPMVGRALKGLRAGQPNMDVLQSVAVGAAFVLSISALVTDRPDIYFETAAGLVTISLLSRMIEARLRRKAFSEVATLMRMQAVRVRLRGPDDDVRYVSVSDVHPGHTAIFEPGESVPFDGISAGTTVHVSEAVLTGEPRPISKVQGDEVVAGSSVVAGTLVLTVGRRFEETRLAEITRSVCETIEKSEGRLRSADRIARWFVPTIILLALATWFVRLGLHGLGYALSADGWFPSVSILAVACPCAFSLAGVAAVTAATGALLSRTVLVKETEQMERMREINHVIFDKTGTLTEGRMKVTRIQWKDEPVAGLLGQVLGAESGSTHPVGLAIVEHLTSIGVAPSDESMSGWREIQGRGVLVNAVGNEIAVGSRALFDQVFDVPDARKRSTVVWFGPRREAQGCFIIEDEIREASRRAVRHLSRLGVGMEIVSGDSQRVCDWVGDELEIERRTGGVSLYQKVDITRRREETGMRVVFVGDGTNDAMAMKQASTSVALARSTDEALTASGFILLAGNINALAMILEAGRKLGRVVLTNYIWAFGFNVLFVPVAALGKLTPLMAMLLMLGSSSAVLFNSLRMRHIRQDETRSNG